MSISTDYTGRTVDALIFQGAAPQGEQRITLAMGDTGLITTGIQKMAQTWMMLFLTERGSMLHKPRRGSSFLTAMRRGRIRTSGDVTAEFGLASELVKRTMRVDAARAGNIPLDEQIGDAQLISHELDHGTSTLRLRIRLTSAAGVGQTLVLPVPLAIK